MRGFGSPTLLTTHQQPFISDQSILGSGPAARMIQSIEQMSGLQITDTDASTQTKVKHWLSWQRVP